MDNRAALDPKHSVVVEACAGSGKTWLLVSRVVRLLLDGVPPGEILAITFTRKAAQEMQVRLRDWLYELASEDDDHVREFLRLREVDEADIERLLPRARSLYQQFLLAQPNITISTFHGWFMQVLQRAPLNAGMAGGVQLVEQTSALRDEAWKTLLDKLHSHPESPEAQSMLALFGELGLSSTEQLLFNFLAKRSEWWAYTCLLPSPASGRGAGGEGELVFALDSLRTELGVDMEFDPVADWGMCGNNEESFFAFSRQLAANGTETQQKNASELERAWTDSAPEVRFEAASPLLYTKAGEPRSLKPTKKQNAEAFLLTRESLFATLQEVRDTLAEQQAYRMNEHALRCGVALLDSYQALKQRQQMLDFGDLEWRVCQLLNDSDHAEYLQYKLDSRYSHVLLDEFQDTNPLQWQILQSWFAAADAVDSRPTVFVVGDPKQSIYRFRRADARLFGVVREFLQRHYSAHHLTQNMTRRNAPAVLDAVNGVFDGLPEYEGFERHGAHQLKLPGYVEVLPLSAMPEAEKEAEGCTLTLRDPLTEPREEREESARELEAQQFAAKVGEIVGHWQVNDEGEVRPAQYADIMVLVRRRTHLKIYEHALRSHGIPCLTSRRGGLLETLEASDIQALLTFLITPFADLQLAHALRTPVFSCSDEDLMGLAQSGEEGSWWSRLQQLATSGEASPHLQRAHRLLQGWLKLADKLPVHDLLDRIYFEGDLQERYAAAVPEAMRATVLANLQAFIEIALNVDAGRYPSLPGFLRELAELRRADDSESPDEGKVAHAGNALRIYTVHESKGLEAPIVWLLDTNAKPPIDKGYDVLLDWPTASARPAHFSLYGDKASRGPTRERYFEQEAQLAQREDLNLLYVAMTRAKQALLVSGCGERIEGMWYDRIANAMPQAGGNPLAVAFAAPMHHAGSEAEVIVDIRLTQPLPTGSRRAATSAPQQRGIRLHALLQHLLPPAEFVDEAELCRRCGIPASEFDALLEQAQALLAQPHLQCYFDPLHYRIACNEMPYVDAQGELKRIDRLVEFDGEVWVLDYKLGESGDAARHRAQMQGYRDAMRTVYAGKPVRCALVFADGTLQEME
ncbi:MAG: UvrD-helicase domain-containing protein [Gallionella sp.]|jgi:ATP-dependent helicase/nuclease subunit A|nr:UvrD-helicase domain-containing protein [Gallionella sp.]MCK9355059.1 UvrD-helicase domain-containing protein [Gallionella sp.]